MKICEAEPKYYNEIYNLHKKLKAHTHLLRPDIEKEPTITTEDKEGFISYLTRKGTLCLVAIDNGRIVGYAVSFLMKTRESNEYLERIYAFIDYIYVEPDCRHKGIGSQIIERIREYYRAQNVSSIELYVLANNSSALDCYHRNGFKEQSIRMELELYL